MKLPPTYKNPKYASFWPRLLAVKIDSLALGISFPLSLYYLSSTPTINDLIPKLINLFTFVSFPLIVLGFVYAPYCLSRFGQTLGKAITGVKITNSKQKLLTFKQAIVREYFTKIPNNATMGFGCLSILFNPDHQGWHDQLSGTYAHRQNKSLVNGIVAVIALIGIHVVIYYLTVQNIIHNQSLIQSITDIFKA